MKAISYPLMGEGNDMFEGLERVTYKPGQHIFKEGDAGNCAYLIEDGHVEVTTNRGNKSYKVGVLAAGDLFGEMALIDNRPRTATITALDNTYLVRISRELVEAKLATTDPTIEHLLRLVLKRFRSTHDRLTGDEEIHQTEADKVQDRAFSETQQNLVAHIRLASDINDALRRGEFQLHYQPILSIRDKRLVGYEALIRWLHPERGLIPPMDFLNVAEQTDQILPIGIWTLAQACHDYQELSTPYKNPAEPIFISINMSARQLLKAKDTAQFADILHEAGIDPACIKLEVTETVMLEDPDYAKKILSALCAQGFQLSLDDFGTGFSSLSHLQKFPVDYLKIDRSFVSQMLKDDECRQIVKASISLAHAMGMQVVAEGVESKEENDELNAMQCAYGQGYYYSKPLPLPQAVDYARQFH